MTSRLFFFAAIFILPLPGQSQTTWVVNPYEQKLFVENKGQFEHQDGISSQESPYVADNIGTRIFFTRKGLVLQMEKEDLTASGSCGLSKGELLRRRGQGAAKASVSLEWLNTGPDMRIIALEQDDATFSYDIPDHGNGEIRNISQIKAFRKIVYRDLYPGIDAEYIFHKEKGIKYNLLVKPGADLSRVKMRYTGGLVYSDAEGNIHCRTEAGGITDHAPLTFYASGNRPPIASAFVLSGDTVSFRIADYDRSKLLVIDPWITTTPASIGIAFAMGKDAAGNIYVFGRPMGAGSFRLIKYNPSGTMLWNYTTIMSTWLGDLSVDPAGNSYISQGGGGDNLAKINSAGTSVIWRNSIYGEIWCTYLNCEKNKLIISGNEIGFSTSLCYVNMSTGAKITTPAPAAVSVYPDEIRGLVVSPNGNIYSLTLTQLVAVDPSFNVLYSTASGHVFNYNGTGSPSSPPPYYFERSSITCDYSYLYTTDGLIIIKRDIGTGAQIASAGVDGGLLDGNAGVAVDGSGNVYVGSQGKVCKYDANLNLLATAAVPGRVFDLLIGNNGEVVACGEGFVASVDLMPTSSMIITCSAAVPLELLTFTGRSEGTANLLEWRTTAEREGVRFEIERSVGGERFEKVATVEGLGLTGGRYTYTDRLQSGTGELIYYRLRQVNEDHTFGYSATITLSRSGLSLLPDLTGNPVRAGEDIKLRVDRHRSDKLDIMIRNAEGRLVYSGTFSPEQGGEYIFIPSASLSSGIYTLQATSPQSTASRKLVIYR